MIMRSRSRKRKFGENQHTSELVSKYTSTSAEKLKESKDLCVNTDPSMNYCILQFTLVFTALQQILKCKNCDTDVKFYKRDERGLGFKICVVCSCKNENLIDSCPKISQAYEINRRFIFAMRLIGIGLQEINNFCGLMDLGTGFNISTYYRCVDNIKVAVDTVFRIVINKAAGEQKDKTKAARNIENELSVSGDGSWSKRGFTSLLGIVSLIGKYSNKILDVIVKSSFYHACVMWKGNTNSVEYAVFYEEHEKIVWRIMKEVRAKWR